LSTALERDVGQDDVDQPIGWPVADRTVAACQPWPGSLCRIQDREASVGEARRRRWVQFSTWFWRTSKWARYGIGLAMFLVITFVIAVIVGAATSDMIGKLQYWVWAGPVASLLFAFGFVEVPKQRR